MKVKKSYVKQLDLNFLVGLDLMGNKLIEVNVCSPGGFAEINEERSDNLQEHVIDFAEQVKNARKS